MSEKRPQYMDFHQLSLDNSEKIKELRKDFIHADSIRAEQVIKCAQEIAEKINGVQSAQEQKVVLIDLLSDDSVEQMVGWYNHDRGRAEVEQAALASVKAIKKRIVRELEKFLPPDLYLFILRELKASTNDVKILADSKLEKTFFKETKILKTSEIFTSALRQSLERLKLAFAALPTPTEMPYVVKPLKVNSPEKSKGSTPVSYTVENKDIVTVGDVLSGKEKDLSVYDGLMAVVDCLRGAKFLADNKLTLTDISSSYAGMNLGLNRIDKKGVLFDLDGLLRTDQTAKNLVAPFSGGSVVYDYIVPEYRNIGVGVIPNSTSMIWEMGRVIQRIAQEKIRRRDKNIGGWEELEDAGQHMMAWDTKKRPDFDTCINVLDAIVNRNFGSEQ